MDSDLVNLTATVKVTVMVNCLEIRKPMDFCADYATGKGLEIAMDFVIVIPLQYPSQNNKDNLSHPLRPHPVYQFYN